MVRIDANFFHDESLQLANRAEGIGDAGLDLNVLEV